VAARYEAGHIMPVISVIIPIFNRADIAGKAIDSAFSQALPSGHTLEVIVIDDGSNDRPREALARFGEKIRLIRHPDNRGAAAARNSGCEAASGDYIAFLDSDDRWLPGKLAAQLAFMHEGGFDVSCTAYELEQPGGKFIVSPRYRSGPLTLADLVWGCFVSPGSTLVCRSAIFHEVGTLDTSLRRFEDWDWLMRLTRTRRLGFLAQPLARVEPSTGVDQGAVFAALDRVSGKHLPSLSGVTRRHFKAACHLERAAALFRSGKRTRAVGELAVSLLQSPLRHPALTAVLHNRLAAAARRS
jgi:glycosyltransferase involved in cell wall biosynthesis